MGSFYDSSVGIIAFDDNKMQTSIKYAFSSRATYLLTTRFRGLTGEHTHSFFNEYTSFCPRSFYHTFFRNER